MATPRRFSAAAVCAARSSEPGPPGDGGGAAAAGGQQGVAAGRRARPRCGPAPWTTRVDSRVGRVERGHHRGRGRAAWWSTPGCPGARGRGRSRCAPVAASRTVTSERRTQAGVRQRAAPGRWPCSRRRQRRRRRPRRRGGLGAGLGGRDGHARRAVAARAGPRCGPTAAGSAGPGSRVRMPGTRSSTSSADVAAGDRAGGRARRRRCDA